MPNPCIFCRSTTSKITKGHVPGHWIAELWAHEPGTTTTGIHQPDSSFITFQGKPLELSARVTCEKCNNGWMNAIETSVQPTLGLMITSARITPLTPSTQCAIATWAVQTALMLQYLHPAPHAIPESEYQRFYAEQQPPQGYAVFLARCSPHVDTRGVVPMISGTYVPQHFHVVERQDVEKYKHEFLTGAYVPFSVLFAVGHVVFIVTGSNAPISTVIGLQTDAIQQIWPISDRVTWPPPRIIGNMSAFQNLFGDSPEETP